MTPWIVDGWNPLGTQPPADDHQVFELLTAAVFQARFRPAVVRDRWPSIRHAFADFNLETVARWPDDKLAGLMLAEGMIRSPKKIRATLRNARDLRARGEPFGSALAYLRSFGEDQEAVVREVDHWAHYIGAPSIRWFVRALHGDNPDAPVRTDPA